MSKAQKHKAGPAPAAEVTWIAPLTAMLSIAFLLSLLAVYQWMELLMVDLGATPSCAIDAHFNCATVWSSSFAKQFHALFHLPIAGAGLVFGLACFGTGLSVAVALQRGREAVAEIGAARLLAASGVLGSLTFAGVSFSLGAWCLTCLGTYTLAAIFALAAARLPGIRIPPRPILAAVLYRAAGAVLAAYLLCLIPGSRTPIGSTDALHGLKPAISEAPAAPVVAAPVAATPTPAEPASPALHPPTAPSNPTPTTPTTPATPIAAKDALAELFQNAPSAALQPVANGLEAFKKGGDQGSARFPIRFRTGLPTAPVHLVEFTDIRCGHCAMLAQTLTELERLSPPGSYSLEPRQFPLASECNPGVPLPDPSGVRCLAAKILICLEGSPAYFAAQHKMFEEQESLSAERVVAIAAESSGTSADELRSCARSPAAAAKLFDDISYASAYQIKGTPLVLINGRETRPIGPLLYGLILAHGDPNAAGFRLLPPPNEAR